MNSRETDTSSRGINSENIFYRDENKYYFLKLCSKYLTNKISMFSYCLMNNHFHFLVRIDENEKLVTQSFSNLFNAYAKAFNKENNRTGSLFEKHFKRIRIENEDYLKQLIVYIHLNPNHHLGITFENYKFSSYQTILSNKKTEIKREEILDLFDSKKNFEYQHKYSKEINDLKLTLE